MFPELFELAKRSTLMMLIDANATTGVMTVSVTPKPHSKDDAAALCKPLLLRATAPEFEVGFIDALVDYTETLGSLREQAEAASAQMRAKAEQASAQLRAKTATKTASKPAPKVEAKAPPSVPAPAVNADEDEDEHGGDTGADNTPPDPPPAPAPAAAPAPAPAQFDMFS